MANAIQEALERKRILRRPQVEALVGISRSSIYQRIQEGTFPAPVRLGPRAVGWRVGDIDAFLANPAAYRARSAVGEIAG
ncbi:transcriptional regulator [Pandoraea terrae]|uniref:Transcriptional regulator n=1 Tax=Pandoraea terrae TaxID=1537710 RepID=A0A5E4XAF6_9BURK|nr:AlpA family transcriptional regulator [Pandoraea terrae]VVE33172.1 transcriptional regulator [Pandoraea terrae]